MKKKIKKILAHVIFISKFYFELKGISLNYWFFRLTGQEEDLLSNRIRRDSGPGTIEWSVRPMNRKSGEFHGPKDLKITFVFISCKEFVTIIYRCKRRIWWPKKKSSLAARLLGGRCRHQKLDFQPRCCFHSILHTTRILASMRTLFRLLQLF